MIKKFQLNAEYIWKISKKIGKYFEKKEATIFVIQYRIYFTFKTKTSFYHMALWTPAIRLWSAKSLKTIRLTRHLNTFPLGLEVTAHLLLILIPTASRGNSFISLSAISWNSNHLLTNLINKKLKIHFFIGVK